MYEIYSEDGFMNILVRNTYVMNMHMQKTINAIRFSFVKMNYIVFQYLQ